MKLTNIGCDWETGVVFVGLAGIAYPDLKKASETYGYRNVPSGEVDAGFRNRRDRLRADLDKAKSALEDAAFKVAGASVARDYALREGLPPAEAEDALRQAKARLEDAKERVATLDRLAKEAHDEYRRRRDEADALAKAEHKARLQARFDEINSKITEAVGPHLAEAQALLDGLGW